jgi:hypothetical protein
MKPLIVSAICFAIALVCAVLLFNSCATKQIQDGAVVMPPVGYILFCFEHPESPFCKQGGIH